MTGIMFGILAVFVAVILVRTVRFTPKPQPTLSEETVEFDKEKGTLVAYSLGNFLGDGEKAGTDYSVLLDLEIRKNGETGKVSIADYSYIPIYLQDETATGGGLRILRVREGITAYEQNFVGKVSESTYLGMKNALEKVDSRFGKE